MKQPRWLVVLGTAALISSCTTSRNNRSPYTLTVDTSLSPKEASIPDKDGTPRPLAASMDSNGLQTDFVEDEMVYVPSGTTDAQRQADLKAFEAKYNAVVVSDSSIPQAIADRVAQTGGTLPTGPAHYLLRLESPLPTAPGGTTSGSQVIQGNLRVSSTSGAGLIGAITAEAANGRAVSANFVAYPASSPGLLHSTAENSLSGVPLNAFSLFAFNNNTVPKGLSANGNGATVAAAWQLLHYLGMDDSQSVAVAVIDGGFYLDSSGREIAPPGSAGNDLPTDQLQWNVSANTAIASGANEAQCSGGTSCPWHGNGSVSTMAGLLNNGAAFAGSGGQVVNPILLKSNMSDDVTVGALRDARAYGAHIISMSFGASCNDFCRFGRSNGDYYSTFSEMHAAGIIMVSSAGNDGKDATATKFQPCEGVDGIICVGALADFSSNRISYSNYGVSVNIWAPTDIAVMDNGATAVPGTEVFTGTSASAPYVAGVIAMMKRVSPFLNTDQVVSLLQSTAWRDSQDPAVAGVGYLNACSAVMAALGTLPDDPFEPNDSQATATKLVPGTTMLANLKSNGDTDLYAFTLLDYSDVTVDVESLPEALGRVTDVVVFRADPSSTQIADSELEGPTPAGWQYYGKALAPGKYYVRVSTAHPGFYPYQIDLLVTPGVLLPDQFEVNDTFSASHTLPAGSYSVTHHTTNDPDFYFFTTPSFLGGRFKQTVGVRNANASQGLTLYDTNGIVVATQTGANASFSLTSASNSFTVEVTGPRGRYEVYNEMGFDFSGYPQVGARIESAVVQFINPADPTPWENILDLPDQWLAFIALGDYVTEERSVGFTGAGLHRALRLRQQQTGRERRPQHDDLTSRVSSWRAIRSSYT